MTNLVEQNTGDVKLTSTNQVVDTLEQIYNAQMRINDKKKFRDDIINHYKAQIAEVNQNFDSDTRDDNNLIETLKIRLQRYYDSNPPVGRKFIKIGSFSFGYNKAQTKYFFNGKEANSDNADLLKFCYNNGYSEFVKTKEYLDWASLKKTLDFYEPEHVFFSDTKELVDGLRAEKVFTVKVS